MGAFVKSQGLWTPDRACSVAIAAGSSISAGAGGGRQPPGRSPNPKPRPQRAVRRATEHNRSCQAWQAIKGTSLHTSLRQPPSAAAAAAATPTPLPALPTAPPGQAFTRLNQAASVPPHAARVLASALHHALPAAADGSMGSCGSRQHVKCTGAAARRRLHQRASSLHAPPICIAGIAVGSAATGAEAVTDMLALMAQPILA